MNTWLKTLTPANKNKNLNSWPSLPLLMIFPKSSLWEWASVHNARTLKQNVLILLFTVTISYCDMSKCLMCLMGLHVFKVPLFISEDWLVFFNQQVMVPCRHLPTITTTTRHLVQPATLRSGALGDPTVGHLEMEQLKLLLQDPQRPQSLQLPLATAGTHGVPKDEIGGSRGSCGKTMDLPTFPPRLLF